jgi:RNA polymerase sigma-70 factor (ECF subfamily)
MYGPYETPRFWQTYQKPLRSYVRKHIADPDEAKDVLQDIFYKIFTYCQRYDFSCEKAGVKNLRAWVFQTAHNAIMSHFRTEKKQVSLETVADSLTTDSKTDVYRDIATYMEPLLTCLPEMYATPLRMDLQGIRQQAIADQLGMGLPAIKSRIQRSRNLLKELMHECFYLTLNEQGNMESFEVKSDCLTLQHFQQVHQGENNNCSKCR